MATLTVNGFSGNSYSAHGYTDSIVEIAFMLRSCPLCKSYIVLNGKGQIIASWES